MGERSVKQWRRISISNLFKGCDILLDSTTLLWTFWLLSLQPTNLKFRGLLIKSLLAEKLNVSRQFFLAIRTPRKGLFP